MKLPILTFEQPIGEFALSVMTARQILSISFINRREFDQVSLDTRGGPQREASQTRIKEIASYSETSDAAFPTPILLALPEGSYSISKDMIEIDETRKIASIVDGQHRMLGLERSKNIDEFVLPVVFVLDATDEQMGLIFAIINGKQTRVSGSVIYDLFNVVEGRNPYKTCHEIARALNSDSNSPFYRRLKMLGRKIIGSNETLSQGTFITHLIKHISNNPSEDFNRSRSNLPPIYRPDCVLNGYYLDNKDDVILKILLNLFSALEDVFPDEWNNPNEFILSKTTGYTGIMKALPIIIKHGLEIKKLNRDYFLLIFNQLKKDLVNENLTFIHTTFPTGNTGESRLRDKILQTFDSLRSSNII